MNYCAIGRHSCRFAVVVAALALAMAHQQCRAAIAFSTNPGAIQPDENVLYNQLGLNQTGNTVNGRTNISNLIVDITSTDVLHTPSVGAARVAAVDNGFSDVMFSLQNNWFFRQFELNVNLLHGESGLLTVDIEYRDSLGGASQVQSESFNAGAGQNFFSILATDNELISSVLVTADGQIIQDIRLLRMGGFVVPEPATVVSWSLLTLGGAGVYSWRRKHPRTVGQPAPA